MRRVLVALGLIALLLVGGCSRLGGSGVTTRTTGTSGATISQSQPVSSPTATPRQATAQNAALTDVNGFLTSEALAKMSAKDRAEASSAQYYALQFGRPGAPRSWQGDTGAAGSVSVGPYVRVNALDCRDFSHAVTISGKRYESTGTACRESDGRWDVVKS